MRDPGATRALGPGTVRAWADRSVQWLADHRGTLDTMNVFPVADSDTGTNLYLTFSDAAAAVAALPEDASTARLARAWAHGALVGARGNSGVIAGAYVGELVRGLLDGREGEHLPVPPAVLVPALGAAADAAWSAVGEPVEGTALTVVRAVGRAAAVARARETHAESVDILDESVSHGYAALGRTTDQLAPLRAAGVLDAGAWGLLLVLDALADALGSTRAADRASGRPVAPARHGDAVGGVDPGRAEGSRAVAPDGGAASCAVEPHDPVHGGGEFEVMYLVSAPAGAGRTVVGAGTDVAARVRAGLARVGQSVAVVGGDGLWQTHVHTDRPLDAIGVPRTLGLHIAQVRARHLLPRPASDGSGGPGLVTVTRAPGLVADLARAGAVVVLATGDDVGPELARAVEDTGAAEVLVLASVPVDSVPRPGVEVGAGLAEVQVVAGAATFAMVVARRSTAVLAEVGEAVRRVRPDRVALLDPAATAAAVPGAAQDVGAGGQDGPVLTAARDLLGDDGTLLTVVTGTDTPSEVVEGLRSGLARTHPGVEVVGLGGGTPGSDVELGAE